jgi:uncharacterized metal-binding protein
MKKRPVKCAECVKKECSDGVDCFEGASCPLDHLDDEDRRILRSASEVEAEFYMKITRLEEIIEFSKRMDYERLGLAFCIGFRDEVQVLSHILSKHFQVYSACCKNCGISKETLKLSKIGDGFEAACNPVGQALLLASEDTQLNLIVGLCVGHDMLFTKHSKAPVSTFVVKDRVLAHNPVGVLYSGYYLRRKFNTDRRIKLK